MCDAVGLVPIILLRNGHGQHVSTLATAVGVKFVWDSESLNRNHAPPHEAITICIYPAVNARTADVTCLPYTIYLYVSARFKQPSGQSFPPIDSFRDDYIDPLLISLFTLHVTEAYLDLISNLKHRIALSLLRVSSHNLEIEKGRFTRPRNNQEERLWGYSAVRIVWHGSVPATGT